MCSSMDEIVVSVICLTYNQADTIRDALEGFVSQGNSQQLVVRSG